MRKVERRANLCLALAGVLFLGLIVFVWRFVTHGAEWAGFYGNLQIYTNGEINRGTIFDRNNKMLLNCTPDGLVYSDDSEIRAATVHVVGDPKGNISTGAINQWQQELIGYDLLNGTYDTTMEGKKIRLTIDAEACRTAYEYLSWRTGTVGVYNYQTGEILCMVSTPTFDPAWEEPEDPDDSVYFNNFLQGTMTPGSTFKLVTAAAAINELPNLDSWSLYCEGSESFGEDRITCPYAHGEVDFADALAVSCNVAFGELAREIGPTALASQTMAVGLTTSLDIDGIRTEAGSFVFPEENDVMLSWAGIGQAEDLVNPCAMMVYMGAIANGGEAIQPTMIQSSNILKRLSGGKSLGRYLDANTASRLRAMMKNNVEVTYGAENFEGLDIYAKSGTAEVGDREDGWFVRFIDNEDYPLAFVVWVQGGGTGYEVGGPIARDVLRSIIAND